MTAIVVDLEAQEAIINHRLVCHISSFQFLTVLILSDRVNSCFYSWLSSCRFWVSCCSDKVPKDLSKKKKLSHLDFRESISTHAATDTSN